MSTAVLYPREAICGDCGEGGTVIVLPFSGIIPNSIQVVIDNSVVIPRLTDRQSYTVSYGSSNATLIFTVPAVTGQVFYITGWQSVSL